MCRYLMASWWGTWNNLQLLLFCFLMKWQFCSLIWRSKKEDQLQLQQALILRGNNTDGHNVLGTWKDQDEATKHNTPKHTRDSTGYPKAWTSEVSECSSLTHKIDMLTCSNTTCLYGDIIKKCKIL